MGRREADGTSHTAQGAVRHWKEGRCLQLAYRLWHMVWMASAVQLS